jgi:hypothetical protein
MKNQSSTTSLIVVMTTALLAGVNISSPPQALGAEDLRAYMHGIEAVRNDDGSYWVMFSATGMPPTGPNQEGSWPHDVYYAKWSAGDGNLKAVTKFISQPEAQEPVSIAKA